MNEFELNIGAHVFCSDGRCGSLAKVALAPETWQVTHLVVEEGMLLKRSRVFPFSSLVDNVSTPHAEETNGDLYVDVQSSQLEDFPVYREETIQTPTPEQAAYGGTGGGWREVAPYGGGPAPPAPLITERIHHGLPNEAIVVDHRTKVEGYDGDVGKLDRLLVSVDEGAITGLVVQQGLLFTTKRRIPMALARSVSDDSIFVQASAEELKELPEYIAPILHAQTLAGSHAAAETYVEDAAGSQALASVERDSDATDTSQARADLATRVHRALFDDPRTAAAVVEVIDERGVITLDGTVETPAEREAAAEIAAAEPGVTTVVNLLRLRH